MGCEVGDIEVWFSLMPSSSEGLASERPGELMVFGLSRTTPLSASGTCLAGIGDQLGAIALTRVGAASLRSTAASPRETS